MSTPENKSPELPKEPEEEEKLPPLRSEWVLPEKEKNDPADYGGSPWGGSNKIIPEADGFW